MYSIRRVLEYVLLLTILTRRRAGDDLDLGKHTHSTQQHLGTITVYAIITTTQTESPNLVSVSNEGPNHSKQTSTCGNTSSNELLTTLF